MTIVERWTARSGPRIRYLDNSPTDPAGLPILFSPGLSDIAEEYAEMLAFLAPRRVLVVEVRGRGRSEAPPTGYAAADHAADLAAVLDEEGIGRFHLMTFSRGTTWGLQLAFADPTRVASVAIGDYRAAEVALPADFAEMQLRTTFRGRPMAERIPRHVLEQVAAASRDRELWDDLAKLPGPLLVAQPGGAGGILTDELVDRYRRARPDVEVVVVPDAPHDLFRPDRLYYPKAVADFLARRGAD
ncbi:MAG TPA: alpha/beta hydrolase [Acidimicrobiales bacterium]